MSKEITTTKLMSEAKFLEAYSRYDDEKQKYETWDDAVTRVMNMHREFYKDKMSLELSKLIDEIEVEYKKKNIVGAQRALQFGGAQLLKNHMKLYNCVGSYADRVEFFGEIFWILLCGCGAGFSVQKHHVNKLPAVSARTKAPKLHVIEDSIEGWGTSLDVLMSSFFVGGGKHPEYEGRRVYFDPSKIRPKNSLISGGFKAPGPDPLMYALRKIEEVLNAATLRGYLRPIDVYDIVMYAADAVISGGVRRSATICLFSKDDEDMLNAKTGNWYTENPQRGRSNNSAMILRDECTREEFSQIMSKVKEFGEPGFLFTDSTEHGTNPCVTGDTKLTVKDHDLYINDKKIAEGVVYEIDMKTLVDNFQNDGYAPLVKSYDIENKKIVWAPISNAAMTKKNANILKITDQNTGKSIRVTPDHKIYTTNRGWVEAKDLKEDDDLLIE